MDNVFTSARLMYSIFHSDKENKGAELSDMIAVVDYSNHTIMTYDEFKQGLRVLQNLAFSLITILLFSFLYPWEKNIPFKKEFPFSHVDLVNIPYGSMLVNDDSINKLVIDVYDSKQDQTHESGQAYSILIPLIFKSKQGIIRTHSNKNSSYVDDSGYTIRPDFIRINMSIKGSDITSVNVVNNEIESSLNSYGTGSFSQYNYKNNIDDEKYKQGIRFWELIYEGIKSELQERFYDAVYYYEQALLLAGENTLIKPGLQQSIERIDIDSNYYQKYKQARSIIESLRFDTDLDRLLLENTYADLGGSYMGKYCIECQQFRNKLKDLIDSCLEKEIKSNQDFVNSKAAFRLRSVSGFNLLKALKLIEQVDPIYKNTNSYKKHLDSINTAFNIAYKNRLVLTPAEDIEEIRITRPDQISKTINRKSGKVTASTKKMKGGGSISSEEIEELIATITYYPKEICYVFIKHEIINNITKSNSYKIDVISNELRETFYINNPSLKWTDADKFYKTNDLQDIILYPFISNKYYLRKDVLYKILLLEKKDRSSIIFEADPDDITAVSITLSNGRKYLLRKINRQWGEVSGSWDYSSDESTYVNNLKLIKSRFLIDNVSSSDFVRLKKTKGYSVINIQLEPGKESDFDIDTNANQKYVGNLQPDNDIFLVLADRLYINSTYNPDEFFTANELISTFFSNDMLKEIVIGKDLYRSDWDIIDRAKAIIIDKLGVDESEVSMDASFTNDLGADSIDMVDLCREFETEFNIKIPDYVPKLIDTVADAIIYIQNNVK